MRVATRIDLASPAPGAVLREPRAHVAGSVRVMRDVVLLIDRSGSTRYVAGRDVSRHQATHGSEARLNDRRETSSTAN